MYNLQRHAQLSEPDSLLLAGGCHIEFKKYDVPILHHVVLALRTRHIASVRKYLDPGIHILAAVFIIVSLKS